MAGRRRSLRPVKGGLLATRRAPRPPASAPCSDSQPSPRDALALTLKHHFAFELREAGEDGVALLVSTVSPARLSTRTLGRPRREYALGPCWIVLEPVDRLPREARRRGNGADRQPRLQHVADLIQLLAREGRLPAAVSVITGLGVLDTGALRFFGRLGLRLREGRHKRDQRIADRHLHRVFGCAVEDEAVDHSLNDDAALHKITDDLGHVSIVSPEPVDPADNEHVATAEQIEQPLALTALGETGRHARHAVVGDDFVDREASGARLGDLMVQGLVARADAAVEDRFHNGSSVDMTSV